MYLKGNNMDKMESLSTHSRTYEEIAIIERIKMLTDIIHNYHVYGQTARDLAMISKRITGSHICTDNNTYKPIYELVREILDNKY